MESSFNIGKIIICNEVSYIIIMNPLILFDHGRKKTSPVPISTILCVHKTLQASPAHTGSRKQSN